MVHTDIPSLQDPVCRIHQLCEVLGAQKVSLMTQTRVPGTRGSGPFSRLFVQRPWESIALQQDVNSLG